jgi:class 3 adenylate cyclase
VRLPGQVTLVRFAWFTCVSGVDEPGIGVAELPAGTVTFFFIDIEASTRLSQEHPGEMRPVLARHDALLRNAITAHGGVMATRPRRA